MRACLIGCLSCLIVVTGCTGGKKAKGGFAKSFYGRTIEYRMDTEARDLLKKTETILIQSHEIEPPIDDELALPLYRDADIDRDHYITAEEAEVFYHDFILKFEDSLGQVKLSNDNQTD